MDYFKTVGGLALGSRLKRLSETFFSEVKLVYAARGFDFEPRFFPLFSLLYQNGETTVMAAAEELNLTHPHISLLAKEMSKAQLVSSKKDPRDARSRILVLTTKGKSLGAKFQPLWADIQRAVDEVITESDPTFLKSLEKMENVMKTKSFSSRVRSMKREQKECQILEYAPKLKPHFERLNREWIEKFFEIEKHDVRLFANPEKEIISKGGDIIFAEFDGEIVGTCALLFENGIYELAKLAVSDRAKGKGVGELLSKEIIKRAKKKKAKSLQLTTNTCLIPAVQLYEKLGFKETFRGQHPDYKRVNLVMVKEL